MTEAVSRRGFLQLVGLGGVALTVPKPLKIVAAKLEELSQPIFHCGYARLTVPSCERFLVYNIIMKTATGITRERYENFYENWVLSMLLKQDEDKYINFLKIPARMVPSGNDPREYMLATATPWMFSTGDQLDFWLTPGGKPRFPLPEVYLAVRGQVIRPSSEHWGGKAGSPYWLCAEPDGRFEGVRLNRVQAEKLGLWTPEEKDDWTV